MLLFALFAGFLCLTRAFPSRSSLSLEKDSERWLAGRQSTPAYQAHTIDVPVCYVINHVSARLNNFPVD